MRNCAYAKIPLIECLAPILCCDQSCYSDEQNLDLCQSLFHNRYFTLDCAGVV